MLPKTNIIVLFGLLFSTCYSQSQAEAQNNNLARPMEEVVVYGKRPGPPLFRVDHDGHVLWIFGSLGPLPKSLEWDPISVEHLMSESQEFIKGPSYGSRTANPIKALLALRKIKSLETIPDGKTLRDILAPDLFERFIKAVSLYAPKTRAEMMRLRPMIAARMLRDEAIKTVGLTKKNRPFFTLLKLAKREDVKITETGAFMEMKLLIEDMKNTPLDAEVSCMEYTLNSISTDLDGMLTRAHAWAEGDTASLKEFDYPENTCLSAEFTSEEGIEIVNQARHSWLDAAETAVLQNEVTFATLSMRELIRPDGLLATLKDRLQGKRAIEKRTPDAH